MSAMEHFKCTLPRLQGPRVLLREMAMRDYKDVFEFSSDLRVARYMLWRTHETPEDSMHQLAVIQHCREDGDVRNWGLVYPQGGRIVGTVGFTQIDTRNNCGEVGFCLHPKLWGQGLMTEALGLVLRYGFDTLQLNRIEGQHHADNVASGAVMKRCGMRYEGLMRQRVHAKGDYWDMCLYAVLAQEYNDPGGIHSS